MEITIQDKLKTIRAHYGSYTKFNDAWGIHRRTCDEWRKPGHKHDAAAVAFVDAVLEIIRLRSIPTVDIVDPGKRSIFYIQCPSCKEQKIDWLNNFCPMCGVSINWVKK